MEKKCNQFHKNKRCSGYFSSKIIMVNPVLDIILFALYDKISRGKSQDVLNKDKETFKCSFTIQTGDELYKIDRSGSKGKQG